MKEEMKTPEQLDILGNLDRAVYEDTMCKLEFGEQTHTYNYEGKEFISCTTLLQEMGITEPYPAYNPDVERARERGTLIHRQVEKIIKNEREEGTIADSETLAQAIIGDTYKWGARQAYDVLTEEAFCAPRYAVAGTADVVYLPKANFTSDMGFAGKIIDIKTGRKPDFWAAAWQLSLYRYISRPLFPRLLKTKIEVLYLENGEAKFKDVSDWIADAEVEALLEAYKNGTPYDKKGTLAIRDMTELISQARQHLAIIENYEKQKEAAEAYLNGIKKNLLYTMNKHGVDKVQAGGLTISKVEGYFRKTIDTKSLKEDLPEVAQKYTKISEVAPSIRLKVNEE
jgi:septum formation topological specificity factor MinE